MPDAISYTEINPDKSPTIVLLHALCHSRHAWEEVVPILRKDYRLLVVDLPGHGKSPMSDLSHQDYIQALVDDLDKLIDQTCAQESPWVVGNSLGGGFLAIQLALQGKAAAAINL
ncbi:alpha/beta fold hydrolase [Corynebacterium sp. 3HC-13]|uniref:alpha/beta fold hydrolase n=1 Tax=Corynebacterium poyangense TaxID=2684405 RepID=UPI001CC9DFED|nr:alpha/beta fold hydrolase [Corynebacterium poyangense]MBZ8176923.1 alpha/beta fold hydrolase [Corynebacterium poyangense]